MNPVYAGVSFTLIAIGIYTVYQSAVVIPREEITAKEEQLKAEQQEATLKEERRQARYGECLSSAWRQYSSAWDSQCELAGEEADCTLPKYRYEPVEADYVREKEMCLAVLKAG